MKISYLIIVLLLFSCSKNNIINDDLIDKKLGILPYKGISKTDAITISKVVSEFYHIQTFILTEKELPKEAFISIKSPRYRADSIIKIQRRSISDSLDYVMGLTTKDISVTKNDSLGNILKPTWKYNDFGIMGLAYRPGESSVISKFRLVNKNKSLELERFKKIVIHEFGHNLGLPHCPNKNCVMTSAAEKISTIDNEKMELCKECKNKLNF